MKLFFSLALFCFATFTCLLSQPDIEWQKSLGGTHMDYGRAMLSAGDGGYLMAGYSDSSDGDLTSNHGFEDCWLLKMDGAGTVLWSKSYGGNDEDYPTALLATSDGGYIMSAVTSSNNGDITLNHGGNDYWIVKLDGAGSIQWQKTYGGTSGDYARDILSTSDGGYIVAGATFSNDGDVIGNHGSYDFWLLKLDADGNLLWQKTLGGTGFDYANAIQNTPDGGYLVAGYSTSNDGDVSGNHGGGDYWLVKLDSGGGIQWQESLGGPGEDYASALTTIWDGGYVVAGRSKSLGGNVSDNHGGYDDWVVKIDEDGGLVWETSLGGGMDDYAVYIEPTTDNGFVVAGKSSSSDGDATENKGGTDFWVVKLDIDGALQWQKSMGGTADDYAYSAKPTTDGGFIVTGESASNNGDVSGNHALTDAWVVKLAGVSSTRESIQPIEWQLFPNPASRFIQIALAENRPGTVAVLSDWLGRQLFSSMFDQTCRMDVAGLPSGIYVLSVKTADGRLFQKKVMKQ
ncbi:MAG: T9SS type A sorting domain-containing protein [Lewinellaceae bacterium]|nr:T9SS type A sorting domain-containing protein [Saprospiraceae bacterium]MCB9336911.1 T9SS type A sorting domain-containing protein [Lewinellaceae bacterium]